MSTAVKTLGVIVAALAFALLGLVSHLDLPASRRAAAIGINVALRRVHGVAITVTRIDRLSLTGARGMRGRVDVGPGKVSADVTGASVDVATRELSRALRAVAERREPVVHGTFSIEDVKLEVDRVTGGAADARGRLAIARGLTDVELDHVAIALHDRSRGASARGRLDGRATARAGSPLTAAGRLEGTTAGLPFHAEADHDGVRTTARLDVADVGKGSLLAEVEASRSLLRGVVRARRFDLSALAPLVSAPPSSLDVTARIDATLDGDTVEGRLTIDGEPSQVGSYAIPRGSLAFDGHADLEARAIAGHLAMTSDRASYGSWHIDRGRLSSDVEARLPSTIELVRPTIELVHEGTPMIASAKRVRHDVTGLRAEGVAIDGLGAPVRMDVVRSSGEIAVAVDAPAIDLARVARVVGREDVVRHGVLTARGDVSLRPDGGHGALHAEVRGIDVKALPKGHASAIVVVRGRALTIEGRADFGAAAHATWSMSLDAPPSSVASLARRVRAARLSADVDLAALQQTLPPRVLEAATVSRIGGRVVVDARASSLSATSAADVRIHASTNGLVVDPTRRSSFASIRSDLALELAVDGFSGLLDGSARLSTSRGIVAALDVKANLPPRVRPTWTSIANAQLSARLVFPEGMLATLPGAGLQEYDGRLAIDAAVRGTLRAPRGDVRARATAIRGPLLSAPIDVALDASYDGDLAGIDASVDFRRRRVMTVTSRVSGVPRASLRGEARCELDRFPVQLAAALSSSAGGAVAMRGEVSGAVTIEELGYAAKAHVDLATSDLHVGPARYRQVRVTADAEGDELHARLALEQEDGGGELTLRSGIAWGTSLLPRLAKRAMDAKLDARGLRLAVLDPLVGGLGLDGRVDGALGVVASSADDARVSGELTLQDGRVSVPTLGPIHGVHAKLTASGDGKAKVEDIVARLQQGEMRGAGEVHYAGLRISSAYADLSVPKKKSLKLVLEGQAIGDTYGDLTVKLERREPSKLAIGVDVKKLDLEVATLATRQVQPLGRTHPRIHVGVLEPDGELSVLPLSEAQYKTPDATARVAKATEIDVHLGRVVVRRRASRVVLVGDPRIEVGERLRIFGRIQAKEGVIEVQGRRFDVEQAMATFDGETPINPMIDALAVWSTVDGSRVFAEFRGPLESGSLDLRSEPPKSKSQILALVLLGDDSTATSTGVGVTEQGTTNAAASVGGALAARGLTEALDDLAGIQATARIDTSRAQNPIPEVSVRLSSSVTVSFAHVIGTPPVTEPDRNFTSFQWRFRPNWFFETRIGDRGTAIADAVWQKRY